MSEIESTDTITPADGLQCWTQSIDDTLYSCWYRQRDDGRIEILARGQRVVLPVEAVALLPASLARAVLARVTGKWPAYKRDAARAPDNGAGSGEHS